MIKLFTGSRSLSHRFQDKCENKTHMHTCTCWIYKQVCLFPEKTTHLCGAKYLKDTSLNFAEHCKRVRDKQFSFYSNHFACVVYNIHSNKNNVLFLLNRNFRVLLKKRARESIWEMNLYISIGGTSSWLWQLLKSQFEYLVRAVRFFEKFWCVSKRLTKKKKQTRKKLTKQRKKSSKQKIIHITYKQKRHSTNFFFKNFPALKV